ncbi:MAG: GNAT family N-acetyltransferase [Mobilitalea sp.]
MEILIKRASKEDVERVIANRKAFITDVMNREASDEFMEATTEYFHNNINSETLLCYIAIHEDQIVASVITTIAQVIPKTYNLSGKIGYVYNVYTLPNYRRQGIATKLLQEVISEARDLGVGELYLNATEDGRPVYEKLDFRMLENEMRLMIDSYPIES